MLLLALLTGCGGGLPNVEEAADQDILLVGNGTEPPSLDPHLSTDVSSGQVISALLEGLVNHHPSDSEQVIPGVAESWSHEGNFQVWTFNLRPDAKWSNGDPVTAQDFAYAYERILTPDLASQYAQMLYFLKGAEAFNKGETNDFSEVGVEVIDDHTLRLSLIGSTPYFLTVLTHTSWFPVHPPSIEAQPGGMTNLSGAWTKGDYVGNGPFVLTEWKPEQHIYVTQNLQYWDRPNVRLQGIYFFPITDYEAEWRMFQGGQLHVTQIVPTSRIPGLAADAPPEFHADPYLGTYYFRFNTTVAPFDDVRVRRALAMAIDREEVIRLGTKGGQQPAYTFVPPMFDNYEGPDGIKYDVEGAKALLADAGFPNGEGFPEVTLSFNTSEAHRAVAEVVQRDWERDLGIDVTLENAEWGVFLDRINQLDYQVARSGWIGDFMDPYTFLELMRSGNGNNRTGWSNERYDQLMHEAITAKTREGHYAKLREGEQILMEEMPVAPIYTYVNHYMLDPRVQNWNPKLRDKRPWKLIGVEGIED